MTAGHQGMTDDGVTDLETGDSRAQGFDPARVLVTHDVGQLDVDLIAPDALDHVKVGAAHAGTPDAHDDICRTHYLRIGHVFVLDEFVTAELLVVLMQDCGFHRVSSMRGKSPSDIFTRDRSPHSPLDQQRLCHPAQTLQVVDLQMENIEWQGFPAARENAQLSRDRSLDAMRCALGRCVSLQRFPCPIAHGNGGIQCEPDCPGAGLELRFEASRPGSPYLTMANDPL